MAYINWKDNYSVNVESMDHQHKTLVSLMNSLVENIKDGKRKGALTNEFNSFMDYAIHHFSYEEEIMLKHKDPNYEAHKVEHKLIIHTLKQYQLRVEKSGLTIELMDVLKHWFLDHIVQLDKKYGIFLNQKGIQ